MDAEIQRSFVNDSKTKRVKYCCVYRLKAMTYSEIVWKCWVGGFPKINSDCVMRSQAIPLNVTPHAQNSPTIEVSDKLSWLMWLRIVHDVTFSLFAIQDNGQRRGGGYSGKSALNGMYAFWYLDPRLSKKL